MRVVSCLLLVAAACGNDLPPPGECVVATGDGEATAVNVPLVGRAAGFDDVRYSPQLGKVVAAPEGTGRVFLVEPDSMATTQIAVPGGVASADASATTVYAADRGNDRIVAFDAASGAAGPTRDLGANPDYVRVAPTTGEVWVTLPGRDRVDVLDGASLQPLGSVDVSGAPEGLTFDRGGRAYVQNGGRVIAIDVARRVVVDEWDSGCGASHGFPQFDDDYGLAIAGCRSNGGVGVIANGDAVAGFEAGGGEAILAYDPVRHHLYVRGDPGPTLDVLAVCSGGGTSVLARVPISDSGHGATADDRGHVWVADATTGGLIRITDPFPATN
ncbi:MAG TPA: hypothetical protein VFQ53_22715 [Kofleriaceae bacterium]|nr:hypothetical protein [Kofleriaceae bacterium]